MGQKENNKGKMEAAEEQKRPGSAVSREFQPNRQQKAGTLWRKQQEEQNQQKQKQSQQMYGFVPFKGANQHPQGASIYGTAIRPSNPAPHQVHPPATDYLHSIYAPPQMVRQQPVLSGGLRGAQIHHQGPVENLAMGNSRPGSDLGMYKMIPSRCQSYTTLPRPEHGVEMLEELASAPFAKSQPQIIYGSREGGIPLSQIPFRPPSAASRSLGRKNSTAPALPPVYFSGSNIFGGHMPQIEADFGEEYADGHLKQIVPWSTISLGSWLTIVFGAAIFCLGAVRLYFRADYAKGQEIFYGISAICNGLVGFFASQNRSFCLFIAAFLLCSINTVFIFVPFLSGILPLAPLLSANGKPHISLGGTKEPVEVDIGLAVLSLMQLAASFSFLLYGCRVFGTTMKHVEQMRMALFALMAQQNGAEQRGGEAGGGKM